MFRLQMSAEEIVDVRGVAKEMIAHLAEPWVTNAYRALFPNGDIPLLPLSVLANGEGVYEFMAHEVRDIMQCYMNHINAGTMYYEKYAAGDPHGEVVTAQTHLKWQAKLAHKLLRQLDRQGFETDENTQLKP